MRSMLQHRRRIVAGMCLALVITIVAMASSPHVALAQDDDFLNQVTQYLEAGGQPFIGPDNLFLEGIPDTVPTSLRSQIIEHCYEGHAPEQVRIDIVLHAGCMELVGSVVSDPHTWAHEYLMEIEYVLGTAIPDQDTVASDVHYRLIQESCFDAQGELLSPYHDDDNPVYPHYNCGDFKVESAFLDKQLFRFDTAPGQGIPDKCFIQGDQGIILMLARPGMPSDTQSRILSDFGHYQEDPQSFLDRIALLVAQGHIAPYASYHPDIAAMSEEIGELLTDIGPFIFVTDLGSVGAWFNPGMVHPSAIDDPDCQQIMHSDLVAEFDKLLDHINAVLTFQGNPPATTLTEAMTNQEVAPGPPSVDDLSTTGQAILRDRIPKHCFREVSGKEALDPAKFIDSDCVDYFSSAAQDWYYSQDPCYLDGEVLPIAMPNDPRVVDDPTLTTRGPHGQVHFRMEFTCKPYRLYISLYDDTGTRPVKNAIYEKVKPGSSKVNDPWAKERFVSWTIENEYIEEHIKWQIPGNHVPFAVWVLEYTYDNGASFDLRDLLPSTVPTLPTPTDFEPTLKRNQSLSPTGEYVATVRVQRAPASVPSPPNVEVPYTLRIYPYQDKNWLARIFHLITPSNWARNMASVVTRTTSAGICSVVERGTGSASDNCQRGIPDLHVYDVPPVATRVELQNKPAADPITYVYRERLTIFVDLDKPTVIETFAVDPANYPYLVLQTGTKLNNVRYQPEMSSETTMVFVHYIEEDDFGTIRALRIIFPADGPPVFTRGNEAFYLALLTGDALSGIGVSAAEANLKQHWAGPSDDGAIAVTKSLVLIPQHSQFGLQFRNDTYIHDWQADGSIKAGAFGPVSLGAFEGLLLGTPPEITYERGITQLAWRVVLNVTIAIWVLLFIWMGLRMIAGYLIGQSQGSGFREMVPRFIMGAIAAYSSYWWCRLLIDLADGVSTYVAAAMGLNAGDMVLLGNGAFDRMGGWGAYGFFVAIVLAYLVYVMFSLLVIGQLVLRIALINLLIALAPIAMSLWILPSTEGFGKKWLALFMGTLFSHGIQLLALAMAVASVNVVLARIDTTSGANIEMDIVLYGILLGMFLMYLAFKVPSMVTPGGIFEGWIATTFMVSNLVGTAPTALRNMATLGMGGPAASMSGFLAAPLGRGFMNMRPVAAITSPWRGGSGSSSGFRGGK